MALQLISYPFRINPSGDVATNEEGTDEQYAEELAQMILTRPGERVLVPSYGINDPTFGELDPVFISTQLQLFGPPVHIEDVTTRYTDATHREATIAYSIEESDPEAAVEDDITLTEGAF